MKGIIAKAVWMISIALVLTVALPLAQGAPANTIMYQGKLTDNAGNPITDEVSVTFTIWSAPSGGINIYETTMPITPNSNGLFTVELGPLSPEELDGTKKYLGITIESDPEMTPRQLLSSAPAAHSSFASPSVAFHTAASQAIYVDTSVAVTPMDSITVYAPAPGYIHVQASMTVIINHASTASDEEFYFQISEERGDITYSRYGFEWISFDNAWPANRYYFPLSASKVFPVPAAGNYKFFGNARMFYGEDPQDGIYNLSFTAIYYPKACGEVSTFSKKSSLETDNKSASELISQE